MKYLGEDVYLASWFAFMKFNDPMNYRNVSAIYVEHNNLPSPQGRRPLVQK